MRKFLSALALSCVLTLTLQPVICGAFAQGGTAQAPVNLAVPITVDPPANDVLPVIIIEDDDTTAPQPTKGIPISDNGLPPNLPRLNMGGIDDPVKLTESFMLTYIIRPIFFLSGGVAIIMIMYSGFQIITARGEEDGITGAKTTLIWSFVGLGLVMLAYTIVSNLAAIILEIA